MSQWSDITRATNAQILAWAEAQPWARAMAACRQDAQWHAEGDVWTHTHMVCAGLERLADWPSLDRAVSRRRQARHRRAEPGYGPNAFAQARPGGRRDGPPCAA